MGRLIAVVLFIAVLVPGVLLARAWALAAGRRAVAAAAVGFTTPTPEGLAVLGRQAQHGRRVRRLGLLLGVIGIGASIALFAEASVFLWLPALVLGLLLGVVLAEATRPRPRWRTSSPARRPRQSELISMVLLWSMRAVVAAELLTAVLLWQRSELPDTVGWVAIAVPVLAWALAEAALVRTLVRPLPAEGADVPVDEALRTWTTRNRYGNWIPPTFPRCGASMVQSMPVRCGGQAPERRGRRGEAATRPGSLSLKRADTVGELFNLNANAAQSARTFTEMVRLTTPAQEFVPKKWNLSRLHTAQAGRIFPVYSTSIFIK